MRVNCLRKVLLLDAGGGVQTMTLALPAPKAGRVRPLVVVIADNAGTETTDFVIPYPRHRPRKFSVLRCASSESEA